MNDMDDDQIPPQDNDASGSADPGAGAAPPPPPPPPTGSAPRPLLRREDDKVLAGVAGGLADFVGADATVVRVAFVVLTVFGGIGVPLYLVGWAGLRTPSMSESHAERWFRGAPNPAALIALAVGFIILINVAHAGPRDGVGWGLALLFAGWLLFRADSRAVADGVTAPSPPATDAATWAPGSTWHGAGGTPAAPPPPAPPRPPRRPRSILGRLTLGVILAVVGVAALLDQLKMVTIEPAQYVALALTITGLGLVVGAWIGRAYGLIALGVILVPVMLVASVAPVPMRGGVGDVEHRPLTLEAVQDRYSLGAGQLELDLSAVQFPATTTRVEVSVGAGETTIIVPDDVTVAVNGELRVGDAHVLGTTTIGRPFVGDLGSKIDEGTGTGRLELSIDIGVGELIVRRASEER